MKIYKIISNLFFGLIGLIALLLIITIFPITGNYKFFIVESGSMNPAIKTGSIVIVKPNSQYKLGDIITFGANKNKVPTTHRIYEIKNDNGRISYITKGDANNAPDLNIVKSGSIIGKVLFSVPFVGYAVASAKTPWGFGLIIGLPAVIIIGDELKKIFLELKKMRKKKNGKHK